MFASSEHTWEYRRAKWEFITHLECQELVDISVLDFLKVISSEAPQWWLLYCTRIHTPGLLTHGAGSAGWAPTLRPLFELNIMTFYYSVIIWETGCSEALCFYFTILVKQVLDGAFALYSLSLKKAGVECIMRSPGSRLQTRLGWWEIGGGPGARPWCPSSIPCLERLPTNYQNM